MVIKQCFLLLIFAETPCQFSQFQLKQREGCSSKELLDYFELNPQRVLCKDLQEAGSYSRIFGRTLGDVIMLPEFVQDVGPCS